MIAVTTGKSRVTAEKSTRKLFKLSVQGAHTKTGARRACSVRADERRVLFVVHPGGLAAGGLWRGEKKG